MKTTYIYRFTPSSSQTSGTDVRFIFAPNKPSAVTWQRENLPDFRGDIECIGQRNDPLPERVREFTELEYGAIRDHLSKMSDPSLWKLLTPANDPFSKG